MAKRLITYDELPPALKFSKPHLDRLEKRGLFPKRVFTGIPGGRNSYAYDSDEIDQHVESLIKARDAKESEKSHEAGE